MRLAPRHGAREDDSLENQLSFTREEARRAVGEEGASPSIYFEAPKDELPHPATARLE